MRLELTGRFHQVAKFAYDIGRLDRIINVENIQLWRPEKEGRRHRPLGTLPRHHVPRIDKGPRAQMNRLSLYGVSRFWRRSCRSSLVAVRGAMPPLPDPPRRPRRACGRGGAVGHQSRARVRGERLPGERSQPRPVPLVHSRLFVGGTKKTLEDPTARSSSASSRSTSCISSRSFGRRLPARDGLRSPGQGAVIKRGDFLGRAEAVHTGGATATTTW